MAIRRVLRYVLLVIATSAVAVLSLPGVSSAASAPSCGNAADTAPHCYVEADLSAPGGIPSFTSMAGTFTVPKTLAVKAPAYSISQISLNFGAQTIELGWIVNPGLYKDNKPHLFAFFRRVLPSYLSPFEPNYCSAGIPHSKSNCSSNNYQQLSAKYPAGMAIGGAPAFFYVGYDSGNKFWYIQYQNQYIARMAESWYTCGFACPSFTAGDTASWYGEVYTPGSKYSCTPMGNGHYGSRGNSASISGMRYGNGGPTLLTASPRLDTLSYPQYWNSNRSYGQVFSSSFTFGGPGDCSH